LPPLPHAPWPQHAGNRRRPGCSRCGRYSGRALADVLRIRLRRTRWARRWVSQPRRDPALGLPAHGRPRMDRARHRLRRRLAADRTDLRRLSVRRVAGLDQCRAAGGVGDPRRVPRDASVPRDIPRRRRTRGLVLATSGPQRRPGSSRHSVHPKLAEVLRMHTTSKTDVRSLMHTGRMLYDGVPYFDLQRAGEQVVHLDQWFDFWAAAGERYERMGEEALAAGARLSGGEWLWQASLSFHYAQFMWFHDPARRERGQRRKVELYNRAAPNLWPPAERIEIDVEGSTIPGFLRMPPGRRPEKGWPCVLLLGGLESTKEESYQFENLCLRRGIATFAFDGPGQGEVFFQLKLQPQFERYTSAVIDRLEKQDELDSNRLGVLGRSLGGFYALRSGAGDDRLRAVVAWAFFHDMDDFEEMPEHTQ